MSQSNPEPEVEIKSEVSMDPNSEPTRSTAPNGWIVVAAKSRVDSFSQEALLNEVRRHLADGQKRIALDLRGTRFFSLQVIRFCVETAKDLASQGGRLALISPPEKTKRHFEIYGSLNQIAVVRTEADLARVARFIDAEASL